MIPSLPSMALQKKAKTTRGGNSELLLRSEVLPFKLGAHRFLAKNSTILLWIAGIPQSGLNGFAICRG
jgi:hypothetical protein